MSSSSGSISYLSSMVPSFSSIKRRVQTAGSSVSSLFTQYIAIPAERYLIGDMRTFYGFQKKDISSPGFAYHSFGLLGGAVAQWNPKSKEELAAALNELDTQPNARSNYRSPQLLINSSPFLLADTSVSAIPHRKEISRFLVPSKYVSLTWDLWKKQREILVGRYDRIDQQHITMQAVAKGLLGIALTEHECDVLHELAKAFKQYSMLPVSAGLLQFSPTFRKEQSEYQQCIETLLQREIQKIKSSNPQSTELGQGLLAQKVIEKMRENPDLNDLHQDPDLKSLILLLLALDNLNNAFDKITSCMGSLEELAIEVDNANVVQDPMTVSPSVLMDKEKMPVLDRLYQKCVNSSGDVILGRYVHNGLQCGEYRVPPRTYLAITAPVENPSPLYAFSTGRRSCPGRLVAEAIFKTIVVAGVCHLSPSSKNGLKYSLSKDFDERHLYENAWEEFRRLV